MTERSNTLVNASLSMQSSLDLHFVIWLKNSAHRSACSATLWISTPRAKHRKRNLLI